MSKQSKQTAKYKEALKTYNKLAKKADRRMRELERFSRYPEFKSILNYAYRMAKRDIQAWTPPGAKSDQKPRWQRNTPMDTRSLQAKIKDIEKFLRKPTSTMTGTKKIYMKRTETINKKYGTDFTWQSLADYFETGMAEKGENYGSKTMLKAIGVIQKNKEEVLKSLKEKTEITITVPSMKVDYTIKELLKNQGLELEQLLNK